MESTRLTPRDASHLLIELGLSQRDGAAPAEASELLLVVGVVRTARAQDASAASALYCAAMQPGTPLERERIVSAVSGLVRRFERAAQSGAAPRLPPPKWG